jgi:hypothetical protein
LVWRREIVEPIDELHTATNLKIARRHNAEAAIDAPCANVGNGSRRF